MNGVEVSRVDLDENQVSPGSTLRPIARFEAGRTSVVLGKAEIFEREPLEHAVARLRLDGDPKAAVAVVSAAADAVQGPVYLPINAVNTEDPAGCRDIVTACGFQLFQEKLAFLWTGQDVPEPALRTTPMSRSGRETFVPVIERCIARTLDRTDALVVARQGPRRWASTFLDHRATGADTRSWLLAETPDGTTVGFVGLAQRHGEPDTGVVVLIGVLPEHRGHHHVDHLLWAAYRAARERGFTSVLSLVDAANHPMAAAAKRSGAEPTPWHKWLYVKEN